MQPKKTECKLCKNTFESKRNTAKWCSESCRSKAKYYRYHEKNKEVRREWKLKNKDKVKKASKEYYIKNKESINKKNREHYKQNKEQYKERVLSYRKNNHEYYEKQKEYRISNPEKMRASTAKYKASKINATPTWSDIDNINKIYNNCPKGYEVDHIIPLQGSNVCGLHVSWNLQYLTVFENRSKGNKIIEEYMLC